MHSFPTFNAQLCGIDTEEREDGQKDTESKEGVTEQKGKRIEETREENERGRAKRNHLKKKKTGEDKLSEEGDVKITDKEVVKKRRNT